MVVMRFENFFGISIKNPRKSKRTYTGNLFQKAALKHSDISSISLKKMARYLQVW